MKKESTENKILKIKEKNPSWGYRKVFNQLNTEKNNTVKKNAVYKFMKEKNLLLPKKISVSKTYDLQDHLIKIYINFR